MALSTPDSEPRLFYGPGPGLRLILLVTLSIVLMVLDYRNQHLVRLRLLAGQAVYPLQQAVDAPFSAMRWAREHLAARERLIDENERLKKTLLAQDGRLQRMAALEAENARMRALLDSTAKVGDQVLIAEIVSVDMDRLRHRVVLNRGSRDGAFLGQALIDAHGVVGQITRDRGTSSEALLITDPDHAVPVEIVRNGLRSIAVGTGDLERLSLPFMARNSDVKPGDLLVSSGLGGTFPAGYPVGTVVEVRGDSGEAFLCREREAGGSARSRPRSAAGDAAGTLAGGRAAGAGCARPSVRGTRAGTCRARSTARRYRRRSAAPAAGAAGRRRRRPRQRQEGDRGMISRTRMSPVTLWLTLLGALALTAVPLPDLLEAWRPPFVTMTIIYWTMMWPRICGTLTAFIAGLLLDVLCGSLLGQHALALTVVAYLTVRFHLQIRIFPLWQLTATVFVLLVIDAFFVFWADGIAGYPTGGVARWTQVIAGGRHLGAGDGAPRQRAAAGREPQQALRLTWPAQSASRTTGPSSACSSRARSSPPSSSAS